MTKSNKNVVLTGTLAGIGEYIGIDPTVIRVLYVFPKLSCFWKSNHFIHFISFDYPICAFCTNKLWT
ncbi:PspC domain-containing protein [Enterococcus faecalis]|nr:PspC domain-containing protein [Enterococcus faecalis]